MSDRQNVRLDFDVAAVGKMRNEVHIKGSFGGSWDMATDEGDFHGGDGTAPPPLAYFVTGFAACFMTQVRAFAKRLGIEFEELAASGWVEWWLDLDGRNPYTSEPKTFGVELYCDSPAPTEQLIELVEAAKKGCFVEQSLMNTVQIKHRIRHNGRVVEVD